MVISSFFTNKVVLVTGSSSGIGEFSARFLASKGLTTILVARREENLEILSEKINSAGGRSFYCVADLAQESERIKLFEYLDQHDWLPDILINNAGVGWYGYFYDMSWNVAKELLSLNIEAVVHLTSLFLPTMISRKYGHIVNIGSISGKLPEQGVALYSSSKNFLDSFTSSLYREMVGTNIHISVLRAGPIKTEFFDAARKLENGGNVPAERMATPVAGVTKAIWSILQHPRKVVYVPAWMAISPLLEALFEWVIDLVGPLLLKNHKKS